MSIAVCILTNNYYVHTRYCIENLFEKTQMQFQLYVHDIGTRLQKEDELLKKFCTENEFWYKRDSGHVPYSVAMNELLSAVKEEYVCFVPINQLVGKDWLEDLYCAALEYEKVGIISIRSGIERLKLMPLERKSLTAAETEFEHVWVNENNLVSGIMFFERKKLLESVGKFNETDMLTGFEQHEYCLRASMKGYTNIYLRKQIAPKLPLKNATLFPDKTMLSWDVFRLRVEEYAKEANKDEKVNDYETIKSEEV